MTPFIGQIIMFGGNFAIRSFALCNGQIMSIAQNTALFSILGTIYGGDGRTSFALPDLRGRVPIHKGQGPGLPNYNIGQKGGVATYNLTTAQMPAHTHSFNLGGTGSSTTVANSLIANGTAVPIANGTASGNTLSPSALSSVGNSQSVYNMQPFLTINFQIALQGVFPSRN